MMPMLRTGLDNSPMYDGIEVIKAGMGETCKYPIYDVGMTGLYMSMCDSLAELAEDVLDRPDVAADLRARLNTTATATQKLMWSEEEGMFLNRHFNGSLSKRVSPFNFHPMIAGVATVEQARRMASEWLMDDEGFCLPKKAVVVADVDAGARADEGVGAGVPPLQSRRAAAVASNSGGGGAGVLNLYYSNRMHDNTVCVDGQCPTTVNRSYYIASCIDHRHPNRLVVYVNRAEMPDCKNCCFCRAVEIIKTLCISCNAAPVFC